MTHIVLGKIVKGFENKWTKITGCNQWKTISSLAQPSGLFDFIGIGLPLSLSCCATM